MSSSGSFTEQYRSKPRLIILTKDNSNQDDWLRSVRSCARATGCAILLLSKHNTYRSLEAADMAADGALKPKLKGKPIVKLEEEAIAEAKDDATKAEPPQEPQYIDLTELDDYEQALFTDMVVFTKPDGTNESSELSILRFTFSEQLVTSVPHHKHRLKTWTEGNIYQLIKLVTQSIRSTGLSRYSSLMQLGQVTFPTCTQHKFALTTMATA
jgi:hypothetical protein